MIEIDKLSDVKVKLSHGELELYASDFLKQKYENVTIVYEYKIGACRFDVAGFVNDKLIALVEVGQLTHLTIRFNAEKLTTYLSLIRDGNVDFYYIPCFGFIFELNDSCFGDIDTISDYGCGNYCEDEDNWKERWVDVIGRGLEYGLDLRKKDKSVAFRVDKEKYNKLKIEASKRGKPASYYLRIAVLEGMLDLLDESKQNGLVEDEQSI